MALCRIKWAVDGSVRRASFAPHARLVKKGANTKEKPNNENRTDEHKNKMVGNIKMAGTNKEKSSNDYRSEKKVETSKLKPEIQSEQEVSLPPENMPFINTFMESPFKVTVVGAGNVGMAVVVSCLLQGVTDQICLIRQDKNKLKGELLDLTYGSIFMKEPKIIGSIDYKESADSALCIVTAAAKVSDSKDSNADGLSKNIKIFKEIIPNLIKYSPNTVLLVVSNPVDLLTYVAWKISGLPKHRVFGTGTYIESSRFRYLLSEKLKIAAKNVQGWVIGHHGDSSVPVWSSVNVGGVPLKTIHPNFGKQGDPENWNNIYNEALTSGNDIVALKGHTSWSIGLCCAELANAVLRKQNTIHPVSTMVQGLFGVKEEVFSSLPCVIGESGIKSIIQLKLEQDEKEKYLLSCKKFLEVQNKVNLK